MYYDVEEFLGGGEEEKATNGWAAIEQKYNETKGL